MSLYVQGTSVAGSCMLSQTPFQQGPNSKAPPSSTSALQQSTSSPVGNGIFLPVRASSVGGAPSLSGLGSNERVQRTVPAQQQRANVRVSTKAARTESPLLTRPPQQKHSADDVSHWDTLLRPEDSFIRRGGDASTSDDGWGGGFKKRTLQDAERMGRGSYAYDDRKPVGTGPLPWYLRDVAYGGLVETAPLNAASGVPTWHIPTEDEHGWVELHTDPPAFRGRNLAPWQEFGDYDLDEARADFQTLQGMLQGLRLGRTKTGRQSGVAKAHETRGVGPGPAGKQSSLGSMGSLRVDRLQTQRLDGSVGSVGRGATSLRTGRPIAKSEDLVAATSLEAYLRYLESALARVPPKSRSESSGGRVNISDGSARLLPGSRLAFAGGKAESANGCGEPGTIPRAVGVALQEGVGRVAEPSGAFCPEGERDGNKSERLGERRLADLGGAVLADERLLDAEDRKVGEHQRNGRHATGSVSNRRAEGGIEGAWKTRELVRGQWIVKIVTPVRELDGGGLVQAHSLEESLHRGEAGERKRTEGASSGTKTAHFYSNSAATSAGTGPDREAADKAAVAAVVSAVTSLLRAGGSVTFGQLEAILEPWVGNISQLSWDRVFEVFESESEPKGVLAVLAWMVGRHTGREPDFERARSTSGAELAEEGENLFRIGSSVEGAETLEPEPGSRSAFDALWETPAERTDGSGRGFGHGDVINLGGGERIRIDAEVLDGALGDQACSCRICASLRGAADDVYKFGGMNCVPNETPDSVWRENGFVQSGGPVTGSGTPPKRRKKLSLITRDACVTAVRALAAAERVSDAAAFLPALDGTIAGQNLRKALIMQLAREGKAEEALSLLRSCSHRGVLLYNVVMDACSKAWLGHERVVALFDRMVTDGLRPSVRSCNIVLSALVRENMLPEASHWLDEMRVMGCKPDAVSYNTLLGARVQFKAAREVFDQMCREGVSPNLRTFNVLIAALAAVGDYQEALTWLQRMKGMRIEASEVTYNSLITACLNGGSGLDEALSVVDMMEEAGFSPDVVTFNILIGACSRFGWLEEREDLLAEMKEAGVPANDITRKMIALHRPDDLERGFRKRFEVLPIEERQVVVVEKRNRRPRGPSRKAFQ